MSSPFPSRREVHGSKSSVPQPQQAQANESDAQQQTSPPSRGPESVSASTVTTAPKHRQGPARVFVQIVGELMITVGVLLLLFVVWQLYWTTAQVQGGMTQRVEAFQSKHPSAAGQIVDTPRTEDPPTVPEPEYGQTFGVLHVPKWNMAIPITQGTGVDVLDTGDAGHYESSQLPGEIGNFALAGHRRTYGNNFRRVDIMEPGDPIVVETDSAYLVYEVFDHKVVEPTQTEVIAPVPNEPGAIPTRRIMTMTTCDPEFGNSHRFILWSELKYWVPKEEGRPKVLDGVK